jgi:hypothetical protein
MVALEELETQEFLGHSPMPFGKLLFGKLHPEFQ